VIQQDRTNSAMLPSPCHYHSCSRLQPQVEPGWSCTPTSPSVCTQGGAQPHSIPSDPHLGPDAPPPSGGGGGTSSGGGSSPPPARKHHRSGWAIAAIVLAAVGAACAVAYAGRERIYDHFPEASANAVPKRPVPACRAMAGPDGVYA